MGRPLLPKAKARTERVVTFLTREERDALAQLANETNRSISATCHDLLRNELNIGNSADPHTDLARSSGNI
ncbi:hypothetical protein DS906_00985 [Ruegeria sp. A3M17]|nr:hypothetical protein DS906_00985 [Ruegeria sp. A3M17]